MKRPSGVGKTNQQKVIGSLFLFRPHPLYARTHNVVTYNPVIYSIVTHTHTQTAFFTHNLSTYPIQHCHIQLGDTRNIVTRNSVGQHSDVHSCVACNSADKTSVTCNSVAHNLVTSNCPHLVGGLVAINFVFPYIGNLIIPIDELIFFRGVAQPPTSHVPLRGRHGIYTAMAWLRWNPHVKKCRPCPVATLGSGHIGPEWTAHNPTNDKQGS